MTERLQKIIAASGLMSRRTAEEAIISGRVSVNGHIAEIGDCAEPDDYILLDGKPIPSAEKKRYFMLNKPRGYVCSLHDEKGRPSVRSLLPDDAGRLYPVGRLDLNSEGLLLMTNDGDFALRCTHPSRRILKTYRTTVTGDSLPESIERLREPFLLDGVQVRAVDVLVLKLDQRRSVLDITVGEGRNREIRRMCDISGLRVERLVRISEGELKLGNLPSGNARELRADEIASVLGKK